MSQIYFGGDTFIKLEIFFRLHADFEAANQIDSPVIGKKTTYINKQCSESIGSYLESESNDILQNGYYSSHSGYKNVDWSVKK